MLVQKLSLLCRAKLLFIVIKILRALSEILSTFLITHFWHS